MFTKQIHVKKVFIIFLLVCALLVGCKNKEEIAEDIILNGLQEHCEGVEAFQVSEISLMKDNGLIARYRVDGAATYKGKELRMYGILQHNYNLTDMPKGYGFEEWVFGGSNCSNTIYDYEESSR